MNKVLKRSTVIILFCFLYFLSNHLGAQDFLGTKTPYHPQQTTYTKAPQGYTPVFINYVGRHGSRFMTSAGDDVMVIDVLEQAKKQNALTKDGNNILDLLFRFETVEKDNYGNITLLGAQEQYDIAQRMQQQYASAFQQRKIVIAMTEKLRTQQSAHAFVSGLTGYNASTIDSVIYPSKTDTILRFYDLSSAYDEYVKSEAVKLYTDSLQNDTKTKIISNAACKKIFKDDFINQINSKKIVVSSKQNAAIVSTISFTEALYDVYSVLFSAIKEMKVNDEKITSTFKNIFDNDVLTWLDKLNSAEDFYEKGPAEIPGGIQITIASPLLRNLIVTTDSCIQSKNTDGIFRFTHAEAISPLATLMEIPQASHTSNSAYQFYDKWKAGKIIPLSANIQWIVYSNGKNFLVKVLLNEKEVKLPVPTASYPYYNWSDVKKYYLEKLSAIKN